MLNKTVCMLYGIYSAAHLFLGLRGTYEVMKETVPITTKLYHLLTHLANGWSDLAVNFEDLMMQTADGGFREAQCLN